MRTGFVILALAGAAAAAPAPAEDWRAASSGDGARAYIDVDSIRRDGGKASFWRELRWSEPRSFNNGIRYDRMGALYDADCAAMTLRSRKIRVRLGDKTLVEGEGDGQIQAAKPGTTAEVDLRAACFDEWPASGPAAKSPGSGGTVDVTASMSAYLGWRACLDARLGAPPRRPAPSANQVESALVACDAQQQALRGAITTAFGTEGGGELYEQFVSKTRAELGGVRP